MQISFFFLVTLLMAISWMPTSVLGAPIPTSDVETSDIEARGQLFKGGKATFFFQGGAAGACGKKHKDTDLIVALDSRRFKKSLCGKKVKISAGKKSVTATIADECPGCANANSLDLSKAAFLKIAALSKGVVSISYSLL